MSLNKNKNRGFTLIELLVVIAIISLLSSVVLAALNDARAKARDARRMEDLRQINTALQLYLQDHEEAPYDRTGIDVYSSLGWTDFLEGELSPYIKKLPVDPLQGKSIDGSGTNHPKGGCVNFNFSDSCSYQYVYRRMDHNSTKCESDPSSWEGCSDKRSYILDATFEKRGKGNYPVSFILGVSYPQ